MAVAPILFAFLLPILSSSLFFKLQPNSKECFVLESTEGNEIVGSYESIGADHAVRASLEYNGAEKFVSHQTASAFHITAEKAGNYVHCFKSLVSHVQLITFNIRSQQSPIHPDDLATADEALRLEQLAMVLENKLIEIANQQEYATMREALQRETTESTNGRVLWWTFAEVSILVILSLVQLYYLRSFFEVKVIV
eukprot:GHVL01032104.1.p1 GENE.GHVL01032104.1~~GHVL01032104.1.p1  ORF type:complete len:196 (-),score=24.97 GHVL01032104.1:322-909(-)